MFGLSRQKIVDEKAINDQGRAYRDARRAVKSMEAAKSSTSSIMDIMQSMIDLNNALDRIDTSSIQVRDENYIYHTLTKENGKLTIK